MKIAILGLGTVGYGVYDIITNTPSVKNVEVVKILGRSLNKNSLINQPLMTTDYNEILQDETIDVIIETMGAKDFSYQCIKQALMNKKHVITANKEVIALHLEELSKIKEENNVSLYYEASVGGGIPIISSLEEIIKTNKVFEIKGILNGTTNFILTKIFQENINFNEALHLAQKLGFAESDPTADLEGLDMVRKIAILSSIAYSGNIDINDVYHYGILNLKDDDIEFIKSHNYVLKLIASSVNNLNKVSIEVEPVLINLGNTFASVDNEFNIITVDANINGPLAFYGKGAGRFPTGNAIVNDLVRIIENRTNYTYKAKNKLKIINRVKEERYYLNIKDLNLVDKKIIDSQTNNLIITRKISRDVLLNMLCNINFYARIL